MSNIVPAAIQLPSPKVIRWFIALSVIGCACTLGADIAANFWSPSFATPFQERLSQHGPLRLWVASIGNLLTMPIHLIGLFLIYLATRPAGPFWSLAPIGLFVVLLMTYPQFIHSSWWFIGDASSCTEPQCAAVLARFEQRVRTEFSYFRIGTVLASIWLVIPILRGRTLLPRWVGVLPFVFIPAVIVLILGLVFSSVPPSLVHLFGGPFLLGILYVASGFCYLRVVSSNRLG
ncbi:hypothetical protein J7E70_33795 [Variovorax paradoxus]|nr:hypothetical protein [Variovorax paradoxus]MBT2305372.1 hypothetical protein [Variovorax paradoxus]